MRRFLMLVTALACLMSPLNAVAAENPSYEADPQISQFVDRIFELDATQIKAAKKKKIPKWQKVKLRDADIAKFNERIALQMKPAAPGGKAEAPTFELFTSRAKLGEKQRNQEKYVKALLKTVNEAIKVIHEREVPVDIISPSGVRYARDVSLVGTRNGISQYRSSGDWKPVLETRQIRGKFESALAWNYMEIEEWMPNYDNTLEFKKMWVRGASVGAVIATFLGISMWAFGWTPQTIWLKPIIQAIDWAIGLASVVMGLIGLHMDNCIDDAQLAWGKVDQESPASVGMLTQAGLGSITSKKLPVSCTVLALG